MVWLQPVAVDEPEARTLLDEYVAMRAATFPGRYTATAHPPEMFRPPAGVFLLLRDEAGTAAGCGGVRRLTEGPAGVRFEVKHLFLRPACRGRGWGRLLLDGLERRARSLGAAELVLDTHHTLAAAGALYASAGFTAIAPYNDNPNATRWLGKPLRQA